LSLLQKLQTFLNDNAKIINISSDAAVNHYEEWGGYGASKSALDHISFTLAKENPTLCIYAFDPGDMRTEMHQAAFPKDDITDRPLPEEIAIPAILNLINQDHKSGRYSANKMAKKIA